MGAAPDGGGDVLPAVGSGYNSGNAIMRSFVFLLIFAAALSAQPGVEDHFEKNVRPVLVKRCQGCHGGRTAQAGLDLTSAAGLR